MSHDWFERQISYSLSFLNRSAVTGMSLRILSGRLAITLIAVSCAALIALSISKQKKGSLSVLNEPGVIARHLDYPHKGSRVAISVCNKPKAQFCSFLNSAKTYGVPLRLVNFGSEVHKNVDKLLIMDAELKKYSNDTVIVFSDCHDVIFNDNFDKMVEEFKKKSVPIILAVEYYCWPDEVIKKVLPERTPQKGDCANAYLIKGLKNTCTVHGPRYVNSGTYIGYAGALKALIGGAIYELNTEHRGGTDDQRFFHEALLTKRYGAHADYCVEFFMCMLGIDKVCSPHCPYPVKHFDHLTFAPTSTRPFMVHFEHVSKYTMFPNFVNSTIVSHPEDEVSRSHKLWVNDKERSVREFCP